VTDYPRISDDPEAAIVRRARTLNRGKPAKREDQRRKSAAMAGRKSQLEQWSAIELSIIQKEIPPAPTAAMYWSRAMTYGNGGPQGPLRSHTANLVGERLYVFGGCDNRTCFNILYILDMGNLIFFNDIIYIN
jgi:hypothetical protein